MLVSRANIDTVFDKKSVSCWCMMDEKGYRLLVEEKEKKPNRYMAKALLVCMVLTISGLVLNEFGIYKIEKVLMRSLSIISLITCAVPIFVVKNEKWVSSPICKYVLMGLLFIPTFFALSALNFHGTLLIIFPLLMVTQYRSKKLFWITLVSTIVCMVLSYVFSFKTGMWDPSFTEMMHRLSGMVDIVEVKPTALSEGEMLKSILVYIVMPKVFVVCVLGITIHGIVKHGIENLENRVRIIHLNETDLLTDLMNRNMYEVRMPEYINDCKNTVTCMFADVNGLHDVNNEQGHEAGDTMLKYIANAVKAQFDKEDVYRIGGDEFVAFAMDLPLDELKKRVEVITTDVEKEGYFVSIGIAEINKIENMKKLITDAEHSMYLEKKRYYESIGKIIRRKQSDIAEA